MSNKCQSCSHKFCCVFEEDCIDDCASYEPKRVKCEDCIVGDFDPYGSVSRLVFESEKIYKESLNNINTYCPKCGTRLNL